MFGFKDAGLAPAPASFGLMASGRIHGTAGFTLKDIGKKSKQLD